MYVRQQSDHARKRYFSCWALQSRFARRSSNWVARTFSMRPRTQMRLALLHWRQISFASKPLIRCKLVFIKAGRWYRSLLMRTCLSAWDEHVVNGLRVIHSHVKIKQGGIASWKGAVRRQKRSRCVDVVISRHQKLLSSRLVSGLVRAWSAVQKRIKRLSKTRHLFSRYKLAKFYKVWRGALAFQRSSRRVCARQFHKRQAKVLQSFASVWKRQTKLEKVARQIEDRARRRSRRSSLQAALCQWLQGQILPRWSRHARRRAAVKLRSIYVRFWKESVWRKKHCECVSGMVTAHERRGKEAEKFLCLMTWARISTLGQAQAKKLYQADRIHRSHMKAATCMTWNQESWAAKVSRQLREKSDRAG